MAMSGRTFSDFSGSVSSGLAEDIDHFCDACLTTGQHIDAHRYCPDCQEYLCKICCDCHLKTAASRNHQLVDMHNIGKSTNIRDSNVCTEKCPEHMQEVIKYFCPVHEALCCHDCIIMHHRACDIDYISKKCADMADGEEYRWTMQKLDKKLQELDDITKTSKAREKEIDTWHGNLITEMNLYRKEMDARLDRLHGKIRTEADKKKSTDKQIIQRILNGCENLSSDIKNLQSSLQANEASRQNGQLYITVKQAQAILKSEKIESAEDGFERTRMQYTFQRSNSLENILLTQDLFGNLSLSSALNSPRNKKTFGKLTHTENINIKTDSDTSTCLITGCAVLSSNKLVLADYNNNKLKVVDIPNRTTIEERSLFSAPGVIAVLPQYQIAVTMPLKRKVLIVTTTNNLSIVRTIQVRAHCRGITYQQGHLYIVCIYPLCVLILNKDGDEKNKISLNSMTFSEPHYLVVSQSSKHIFISVENKNCVVSITFQGEVAAVYKHRNMKEPVGMLPLDDGSVLVCCLGNHTIHHISGDLKQGQTKIGGLQSPYSICYNPHLNEIYVGSSKCDQLYVIVPK